MNSQIKQVCQGKVFLPKSKIIPETKTTAKRYFAINFTQLIHKACRILSTFVLGLCDEQIMFGASKDTKHKVPLVFYIPSENLLTLSIQNSSPLKLQAMRKNIRLSCQHAVLMAN
jgi:hypothetical protein